jgi:lipoprotein-releasing system ATP-binding protein
MIEASNLEKSYGVLPVLKGISLKVDKAEVVAIVGKSGAGKSTLLHLLGGLDRADKGSVTLNGVALEKLDDKGMADFRNRHVGFIFQFHHLLPEFTALENVSIPAWIAKISDKEARTRAAELLDYLGLSERLNHKPAQLSGGEQQRVAVARALMNRPEVIFADEPSGNLDTATSREMHSLFFKLRDEFQQTFFIVTHNEELAEMADRKITLSDGRIV